jgi:anti-sigma factor RsiW
MACEVWRDRIDRYLDGELAPSDARAFSDHLHGCADCAADALARMQLKKSVAIAGTRYQPSAELRSRIAASVEVQTKPANTWWWRLVFVPALAVAILSVAVGLYVRTETARRERVSSELTDLHVATLASTSPVDVVSSDRHTVKPWFQGKIPFTFSLPELQGSEFTLVGGRVTYLEQVPGAHLVYQIRKHEISVFIFPARETEAARLPDGASRSLSFNLETWTQDGLRYFVIGDTNTADIEALTKLLRGAG